MSGIWSIECQSGACRLADNAVQGVRDWIVSDGDRSATLRAEPVYQSDPVHVCDSWWRQVKVSGEVVSYGPYTYNWDGRGQVYVSASPSKVEGVLIDDHLDVSGPGGNVTVSIYWGGAGVKSTLANITSILFPGTNTIVVSIRDQDKGDGPSARIGTSSPLYIMRAL